MSRVASCQMKRRDIRVVFADGEELRFGDIDEYYLAWLRSDIHEVFFYRWTGVPMVPHTIRRFACSECEISEFPDLPVGVEIVEIVTCQIRSLPDLSRYEKLRTLEIVDNNIEEIVNPLPPALHGLDLQYNCIKRFDTALPDSLQYLCISYNQLRGCEGLGWQLCLKPHVRVLKERAFFDDKEENIYQVLAGTYDRGHRTWKFFHSSRIYPDPDEAFIEGLRRSWNTSIWRRVSADFQSIVVACEHKIGASDLTLGTLVRQIWAVVQFQECDYRRMYEKQLVNRLENIPTVAAHEVLDPRITDSLVERFEHLIPFAHPAFAYRTMKWTHRTHP